MNDVIDKFVGWFRSEFFEDSEDKDLFVSKFVKVEFRTSVSGSDSRMRSARKSERRIMVFAGSG